MPEAIVHSLLTFGFMRLGDGSVVIHRDGVRQQVLRGCSIVCCMACGRQTHSHLPSQLPC